MNANLPLNQDLRKRLISQFLSDYRAIDELINFDMGTGLILWFKLDFNKFQKRLNSNSFNGNGTI